MTTDMPKFFEYMKFIGNLKKVERTGWVKHGVKHPESVAEHMYRMAMITFALPSDSPLDRDKCMKIALVHDVAESIVGDITPSCGVSKADKFKMEENAFNHIVSFLPGHGAKEVLTLWQEYEFQSSPEAKFVKDVDKFEMIFQAVEYEKAEGRAGDLEEFFTYTQARHKFSCDIVKSWADELMSQRRSVTDADWAAGLLDAKKSVYPPQSSVPTSPSSAPCSTSKPLSASLPQPKPEPHDNSSKKRKFDASGDGSL